MANVAVSVTQSLAQHAFRLLGIADLNALLVVEDPNGNRLWTANGTLRNEFLNEGRIDNRKWAMEELQFEDGAGPGDNGDAPAAAVAAKSGPKNATKKKK